LDLPQIVLLDGGMGRELRFRGVEILDTIWAANGLLTAPDVVREVHLDFITAGGDVITTNTYGLICLFVKPCPAVLREKPQLTRPAGPESRYGSPGPCMKTDPAD
jgi:S-methylmethionine-dependent homocysteine/selenocysteine methylase